MDGKRLAVSDGRGVSLRVSVAVAEAVCVMVGVRVVTVFVGMLVSTKVGGTGVDVRVQANEDKTQTNK